ncbi:unnamed protein product, partial [Ectocarpus fasciculatus]
VLGTFFIREPSHSLAGKELRFFAGTVAPRPMADKHFCDTFLLRKGLGAKRVNRLLWSGEHICNCVLFGNRSRGANILCLSVREAFSLVSREVPRWHLVERFPLARGKLGYL